ncbi:MAG: hypothetical protein NC305_03970 [Lachnospiraceae bacterium]|nr:hypothetical protein [Muribaculaceae bacterium]MCM1409688.1 hypothetical protein [Lachnospiraceae bacterium]
MKTVSWYLHSFQMVMDDLVIITPDRECRRLSFGRALDLYGHMRVSTAVVSSGHVFLILAPADA